MRTPYYVIHEDMLEDNIKTFQKALKTHWGDNSLIGYSVKTNSLPWILKFMLDHGCYGEIVSNDEYDLAEKIGFGAGNIIYNGPVKTKESFFKGLKNKNYVNLDSERELAWLEEYEGTEEVKAGLRVNFDLEKACPGDTVSGEEGGRFGYNYENGCLREAVRRIKALKHVKLAGLHMHNSTYTRTLKVYRTIAEMACRIGKEMELDLEYVDMGGGFYGGLPEKPSYDDYMKAIAEVLKKAYDPKKTTLIVEPGASVICGPIDLVTAVLDVKDTNCSRFVVTDGSRIYIDPHMKMRSYYYDLALREEGRKVYPGRQIICGMTCVESDRLIYLEHDRELCPGDLVIYHKAGSYTMCYSPAFIQYYPAVYVEKQGSYCCVREKWTAEEYVQNSRW